MASFASAAEPGPAPSPTAARSHACSLGYATSNSRDDYLRIHNLDDGAAALQANHLVPDPDRTQPLFYWQLFHLLGEATIVSVVRNFYSRIFTDNGADDGDDDADPDFLATFTSVGDLEHHVKTQAAYWMDAFGGGKKYHGGHSRLNEHHQTNARRVMNADGARRWMRHMGATLREFDPVLRAIDPRAPLCLVDFLRTKMKVYSEQFGWKFEEADFDLASSQDPDVEIAGLSKRDAGSRRHGKIRYGRRELEAMSEERLRDVCRNLARGGGEDAENNLENLPKVELVGLIVASPAVDSVVDAPAYSKRELLRMDAKVLKKMAKCLGVNTRQCTDRREMVEAIASSGRLEVTEMEEEDAAAAAAAGGGGGGGGCEKGAELRENVMAAQQQQQQQQQKKKKAAQQKAKKKKEVEGLEDLLDAGVAGKVPGKKKGK
jgi:truncated hemoglobin YjbI/NACalpha-BTF3-like transcription factor